MAEALRLADALMDYHQCSDQDIDEAAAELRRLHAENASLSAALASSCDEARDQLWEAGGVAGCSRALSAEFQRDALLEALKEIVDAADGKGWEQLDPSFKKARAAIALAEGRVKAAEGEKT